MADMRPAQMPTGSTGMAAVPTQNAGLQQQGRVWADLGLQVLTKSLPLLGATSKEGQAVAKALGMLGGLFGQPPQEVTRAALKQAMAALDPAPATPPDQAQAFDKQMRASNRPVPVTGAQGA